MANLQSNKKAMRKAISSALRSLSTSDIQTQSEQVVSRVIRSSFFQKSQNVSCYLSMPTGELNTASLVSEILRTGKTLFVPKIDPAIEGRMDFLQVYGEDDLKNFPSGLWGIKEPDSHWRGQPRQNALNLPGEGLDLILLPGVTFDRSLSRLGHGKGYYDRFISTYASNHGDRKPLLVALALREQILDFESVPVAAHDWKMDAVVGPDEIIKMDKSTE